MRNILLLILRFKNFLVYAFFSLVAFSLMINFNHLQRSNWLNSSGAVTGTINASTTGISDYFYLKTRNKQLASANAKLQTEILTLKKERENSFNGSNESSDSLSRKNLIHNSLPHDSTVVFLPALVINNSINSNTNFIGLNKGEKDGLSVDDGVITENGIIGRIVSTSTHFSLVKSILHINNAVSVKLTKQNELGTLVWVGEKGNTAVIKNIPRHTTVTEGDSVFTSGYGTVYPPHHFVGTISKAELPENDAFYDLKIQLSVNYNSIKHVYVYKNLLATELRGLNAQTDTIP